MRHICLIAGIMALSGLLAQASAAADTQPHALALTASGPLKIKRVYDLSTQVTGTDAKPLFTAHSEYLDLLTPAPDGFTVDRTLTDSSTNLSEPGYEYDSEFWIAKLTSVPNLIIKTGPYLYPRTIENWPEIRPAMMAKLSADSDSPGAMAAKTIYTSLTATTAVNVFFRADILLTLPHKYALVIGQPKLEDTVMPAPVGTGAVTYTASFTLERWDEKADVAEIDYHFTPDPKSMADYMRTLIPTVLGGNFSPEDVAKATADMRVSNDTHCHFLASISAGLTKHADCEVTVVVHVLDFDQVKTMRYSLSEAVVP